MSFEAIVPIDLPLTAYGLADASISELHGGAINRVFRVQSARGDFVLKQYSGVAMDHARMQLLTDAQTFLRRAGIPVPALIPATNSADFVVHNGLYHELLEFVTGRIYADDVMPSQAAANMGSMHARMLEALKAFHEAPQQVLPDPETIRARLLDLLECGRSLRKTRSMHDVACTMVEQGLRMLEAWQGPAPAVRMQWTHGDYTWRNLFFDANDSVCGILDFDNFQAASAGRDVMRCFTYSFSFGSPTALEYFAGYARTANLSPTEAREYVRTWHYLSTYRMWPAEVLLASPALYQERWGEFMTPKPPAWEAGWDALANQLAEIAQKTQQR